MSSTYALSRLVFRYKGPTKSAPITSNELYYLMRFSGNGEDIAVAPCALNRLQSVHAKVPSL